MNVFTSTLSQMGFLAVLIVIGYVLTRFKLLPGTIPLIFMLFETVVKQVALFVKNQDSLRNPFDFATLSHLPLGKGG